jgi:hypothetical protein
VTKEDKKGIAIIASLVLLGVTVFYLSYQLKPKEYRIDEQSLCSKDEVVKVKKIVLIDKSDKWSSHNIEKMDSWLSDIHEGVAMNSRLNILSISGDDKNSTNVKTLFDKCSPGSNEDCNALYENCRDIKENYDRAFQEPLVEITEMLAKPDEAETSPLFETMTEIVDNIQSKEAEIHIISDFMENSYKFNFYKEVASVDEIIKEYALPSDVKIRVYMHIIERRKHSRELLDKVKEQWKEYFEKQGITVVSAKRFFITD